MRTFGIAMRGCEAPLERLLQESAKKSRGRPFVYLEIGVAHGATLLAMSSILHETLPAEDWLALGLDIRNGWSLNLAHFRRAYAGLPFPVNEFDLADGAAGSGVNFYLCPSVEFLSVHWSRPIDFALIDGCHCISCAKADFEAVARHCLPGSIVVFHDAARDEESPAAAESENHGAGIKVYTALQELGLLENHPEWKQLDWILGDKTRGVDSGNSCAVFEKT